MPASIVINQAGIGAGVAGKSRDDGLLSAEVTCSNSVVASSYLWTLVDVPIRSALVRGTTATTDTFAFTPDVKGTYLVTLRVNGSSVANDNDEAFIAILTTGANTRGWRYKAAGEKASDNLEYPSLGFAGDINPRSWATTDDLQREETEVAVAQVFEAVVASPGAGESLLVKLDDSTGQLDPSVIPGGGGGGGGAAFSEIPVASTGGTVNDGIPGGDEAAFRAATHLAFTIIGAPLIYTGLDSSNFIEGDAFQKTFYNTSSSALPLILMYLDGGSVGSNQLVTPMASQLALMPGEFATVYYSPALTCWVFSNAQAYTDPVGDLIYDPDAIQSGNVYASFDDVILRANARDGVLTRIHMKEGVTLSAGTWDFSNIIFYSVLTTGSPTITVEASAELNSTRSLRVENVHLETTKTEGNAWVLDANSLLELRGVSTMTATDIAFVDIVANLLIVNLYDDAILGGNPAVPVLMGTGEVYLRVYNQAALSALVIDEFIQLFYTRHHVETQSDTDIEALANATDPVVNQPTPLRVTTLLSGETNNYSFQFFPAAHIIDLVPEEPLSLTGFQYNNGDTENANFIPLKCLHNNSLFTITLPHDYGGSDPENRFYTSDEADAELPPGGVAFILYSLPNNGWRLFREGTSGGGGGGGVIGTAIDADITTANDTPTLIHTYTSTASHMVAYEINVIAGHTDNYANFVMTALFKTSTGNVPTELDVVYVNGPFRTDPLWDVTFDINGNDIEIKVTGHTSNTVHWRITGRLFEHTIGGGGGA